MVAYNYGPTWADRTRRTGADSIRPIRAIILETRPKAILIRTATRTAWLPKRFATPDPVLDVIHVPSWLCEKKLLD